MKLPLVKFVLYTIFSISLCYSMEPEREILSKRLFPGTMQKESYFFIGPLTKTPLTSQEMDSYFEVKVIKNNTISSMALVQYLKPVLPVKIEIFPYILQSWIEQIHLQKQQSESIILASLRSEIKEAESEIEKNTTLCNILKQELDTSEKQAIQSQYRLQELNKTIEKEDRFLELSNKKIAILNQSISLQTQINKSIDRCMEIQKKIALQKKKLNALNQKKNNQQGIKSDLCKHCTYNDASSITIDVVFENTSVIALEKRKTLYKKMKVDNQDQLISQLYEKSQEHFQRTILSNNEYLDKENHLLIGKIDSKWIYMFSPCTKQIIGMKTKYRPFEMLKKPIPSGLLCEKPCSFLQLARLH